ncbi:MAG: ribonuclease P protein component [Firmicutes bacterium]|nr:ribonuclease P protein component [Candidatus Colimorpha enterica]
MTENHLFVKAYSSQNRYVTPRISVYILKDLKARRLMTENPLKQYINRIGFSATPKLGNAVVRNRCKRIMRAAYRKVNSEMPLKKGYLIVISARSGAVGSCSAVIYSDLCKAFGHLGLIRTENN